MTEAILECACVILAGGSSRRMGVNKLLLPWGNSTILGHIIRRAQPLFRSTHIIGEETARCIAHEFHAGFVLDINRTGPLSGILLGFETSEEECVFVIAADLPFITEEAIHCLWRKSHGADVTVVQTTDGYHPLFGVYRRSCIPFIQNHLLAGHRKVTGFWDNISLQAISVGENPEWKHWLFNINSPEDYQKALALLNLQNREHCDVL